MPENLLERIEIDREVILGELLVQGTRITVEILLDKIKAGIFVEEI